MIFKSEQLIRELSCYINLHSNLVIFKSESRFNPKTYSSAFTFQSGDIQIEFKKGEFKLISLFTFQSGDIQMEYNQLLDYGSNVFTFQSGDIQIL